MVRYCKQILKYECGPIALLNLCKWYGRKASYRGDMSYIKYICQYDKGVYSKNISQALIALRIKYQTRKSIIDHNKIQLCLHNPNCAVIIDYDLDEAGREGHIIFADKANDDVLEAYKSYKIDQVWFFKRSRR